MLSSHQNFFLLFNLRFIHFFFKAYLSAYRADSAAVAITTTDLVSKSVAIESLVLLLPTLLAGFIFIQLMYIYMASEEVCIYKHTLYG
jgi:hypothetical protein